MLDSRIVVNIKQALFFAVLGTVFHYPEIKPAMFQLADRVKHIDCMVTIYFRTIK